MAPRFNYAISQTSLTRECLKLIPHDKFSFAKIWLMSAQFEIRQLNLKGAQQILGNAIGKAPKDKVHSGQYFAFISLILLKPQLVFLKKAVDKICSAVVGRSSEFSPWLPQLQPLHFFPSHPLLQS